MKNIAKMASPAQKQKRIRKKCSGCCDTFTCYQQDNYDYCRNCVINGNRYVPGRFKPNLCAECGNGRGIIKFPNQKPRLCKTCTLTKPLTKSKINCFYGCSFITTLNQLMEQHYHQKHPLKSKEVNHA